MCTGNDSYLHDDNGVSSVLTNIDLIIEDYTNAVDAINSKLAEIAGSDAWIDAKVKTAFMSTYQSYMNSFTVMEAIMIGYRDYINGTNDLASFIEQHYGG